MAMFTLHRTFILRTTKGHSIRFIRDTPTWVPPVCEAEAVAIGAIASEGDVDLIPEGAPSGPELSPEERQKKLFEAYDVMLKRNERGDFTASNQPHCKKLYLIVGFEVPPPERDETWQKYKAEHAMKDEENA